MRLWNTVLRVGAKHPQSVSGPGHVLRKAVMGGLDVSGVGKMDGNGLSVSNIDIFFGSHSILGLIFSMLTS